MKLSRGVLTLVALVAVAAGACGSDTKGGGDAAAGSSGGSASGSAGMTGSAGTTGSAGATGAGGTTGSAGRGGTTGTAGTTGAGGTGTQPVGAACVNNGMCSQADGPAVCCLQITTCVLDGQCPGTPNYVSCETMPCDKAGWICCNAGGMRFCTKQNGCPAP